MNNRRKVALAVIPFLNTSFFAQVGINNVSPQQTLHISGTSSGTSQAIVRIEGLNSTNNAAHEDTNSLKRVFATSDGDLVILNNNQTNIFYVSPALPATAVAAGLEASVFTYTFTLDYPSVVHVEARMGISISDNIANISDYDNGQARSFGGYYKFTLAPAGVATNVKFGETSMSHSTSSGNSQLSGIFYLEPRKHLFLPKGKYTIVLYGYSGDSIMNLSINATSQANQQMRVSITPVIY